MLEGVAFICDICMACCNVSRTYMSGVQVAEALSSLHLLQLVWQVTAAVWNTERDLHHWAHCCQVPSTQQLRYVTAVNG